MFGTPSLTDCNVRSAAFYLLQASVQCRRCGGPTPVLAFALPPNHETLSVDELTDTAGLDERGSRAWESADFNAILFYVEKLSDDVRTLLSELATAGELPQRFRPARSEETSSEYWANHCEHCGALLVDYDLHCEPDGAFVPSSEAAAANIRLLKIERPFSAVATGYSFEPAHFSFMRES